MRSSRRARTVVFDGDCAFCSRSIRLGHRLDWLGRIEWSPRKDSGLAGRFPGLDRAETAGRMLSIAPDGTIRGGFRAVRDVALRLPLTFLPALLLYLPGMTLLGDPVYRWIASRRHRIGGAACGRPA